MNTRKKTISSRVIAFVTAAIFIIYLFPFSFSKDGVGAAGNFVNDRGTSAFPDSESEGAEASDLIHDDTLYDNGNGTFTFKSEMWASYSFSDESQNRARTQDGYFELKKAGSYLVELWGGNGGSGSKLGSLTSDPGNGGEGGFVYGILNVTEDMLGKVLYYEVGSNGQSITRKIDDGGSGGIGGGAGSITLISVGAGGGYSALYLADKDSDLSGGVLNEASKSDPEKVLMIAGGGGGGGAGSNLIPVPVGRPDGGKGGTIDSLEYSSSVDGFSGRYYAGADGFSSGKKTTFTGKGGTDVPGEVNQSVLGIFEASAYPNDWLQTYHPEDDRGSGGAGNLRGGGGGAGFAGGSGGLQLTAVAADNVGGGGGGSSYISNRINAWKMTNNDEVKQYFTSENTNRSKGGSVIIRYIPDSEKTYEYLKSEVNVSGRVSDCFDIVDCQVNEMTKEQAWTCINKEDGTFSFTGYVTPHNEGVVLGEKDKKISYTLVIRPKSDFIGGNAIPVFDGDVICKSAGTPTLKASPDYSYKVTHVNVPFSIKADSVVKTEGSDYTESDLFSALRYSNDSINSNGYIESVSGPVLDSFTADKSEGTHIYHPVLTVKPKSNGENSLGVPNPDPTVIKTSVAVQVINEAAVTVDGMNVSAVKSLNYSDGYYDLAVDMKIVPENGGKKAYVIEPVEVDKNYENKITYGYDAKKQPIPSPSPTPVTLALTPGYYYFEATGGDGGKGADYATLTTNYQGGKGGKGGGVKGVIYIDSPKTLTIEVGYNGAESFDLKGTGLNQANNKGGYGGGSTVISVVGHGAIVIAGGGAGGGKGHTPVGTLRDNDGGKGGDGGSAADLTEYTDSIIPGEKIINGEDGYYNSNENAAKSAKAAENCVDKTYVKFEVPEGVKLPEGWTKSELSENKSDASQFRFCSKNVNTPNEGGAVKILRLAFEGEGDYKYFDSAQGSGASAENVKAVKEKLDNYVHNISLNENFSKYFELDKDNITVSGPDVSDYTVNNEINGSILSLAINLDNGKSDVDVYPVKENGVSDTGIKIIRHEYDIKTSYSLQVHAKLKPKEGFLGGNDVPLLNVKKKEEITGGGAATLSDIQNSDYMKAGSNTEISIVHNGNTDDTADDKGYVKRNAATDWANVEIDTSCFEFRIKRSTAEYRERIGRDDLVETLKNPFDANISGYNSLNTEFVEYSESFTHRGDDKQVDAEDIFEDTGFTYSVSISPKSPAVMTGTVLSAEKKTINLDIPVFAVYRVKYILDHMFVDRVSYVPSENGDNNQDGSQSEGNSDSENEPEIPYPVVLEDEFRISDINSEKYTAVISPVTGYRISGNASISGITRDKYTYSSAGGQIIISIPKENINNNIIVQAAGIPVPHKVHYIYESYDTSIAKPTKDDFKIQPVYHDTEEYFKGALISDKTSSINIAPAPSGYVYEWSWPDIFYDKDGTLKSEKYMGDEDVYVTGRYAPVTYNLKIKYSYTYTGADGQRGIEGSPGTYEIFDYESVNLEYGSQYSVMSPHIRGKDIVDRSGNVTNAGYVFFPDKAVVCGTISENTDEPVTVTYKSIPSGYVRVYTVKYDESGMVTESDMIDYINGKDFTNGRYSGFESFARFSCPENYKRIIMKFYNDGTFSEETTISGSTSNVPSNLVVYYVYLIPESLAGTGKVEIPQTVGKDDAHYHYNEKYSKDRHYYYEPALVSAASNSVKAEFDADGGMVNDSVRTVVTGKEYGFIPASDNSGAGTYGSLPKAVKNGFTFEGWYIAGDNGTYGRRIEEDTIVLSSDITSEVSENDGTTENVIRLKAKWISSDIRITVKFQYAGDVMTDTLRGTAVTFHDASDNTDYTEKVLEVKRSQSYYYEVPAADRYEPDGFSVNGEPSGKNSVSLKKNESGRFTVSGIAQDDMEITVYYSDVAELTVNVYSSLDDYDYSHLNQGLALTGGEFELCINGTVVSTVQNIAGTLKWSSTDSETAELSKGMTVTVRCTLPPPGYREYSAEITLDNFKTEKNIFLEPRFMLPFTGTTDQTIYYCVGAGIMLIAAVLLYKTLKKEKQNDDN